MDVACRAETLRLHSCIRKVWWRLTADCIARQHQWDQLHGVSILCLQSRAQPFHRRSEV